LLTPRMYVAPSPTHRAHTRISYNWKISHEDVQLDNIGIVG
jgi:hypothetical protein